jgi:hypothetical protein
MRTAATNSGCMDNLRTTKQRNLHHACSSSSISLRQYSSLATLHSNEEEDEEGDVSDLKMIGYTLDRDRLNDDDYSLSSGVSRSSNRRAVLLLSTLGMISAAKANAEDMSTAMNTTDATKLLLPKDYAEKLRQACEALLKSVEFERDHPNATTSERFAAADPAKQAVKEYIQTWQGRAETRDLETSAITSEFLRELASYYKKNCSQVALMPELRDDVIEKLNDVLSRLPAKPKSLADRILNL